MAIPLPEVISTLSKASKNEVLVVDVLSDAQPTFLIAEKKDDGAFRARLEDTLAVLGLGSAAVHLHDWGGVVGEADAAGRTALRQDVLDSTDHLVFSFTPWNEKGRGELLRMATFARTAGFRGMVIMTKKEGKRGKADTFSALQAALPNQRLTYYEDTYDVLVECGHLLRSAGVAATLQHVHNPEFPVEEKDARIQDGTRDDYLALWHAPTSVPQPPPATHGLDAPTPASLSASHLRSMTGLDDHMSNFSYVEGHFLSQADIALHVVLGGAPEQARHPHAARWYKHISFLRAHYAFGV